MQSSTLMNMDIDTPPSNHPNQPNSFPPRSTSSLTNSTTNTSTNSFRTPHHPAHHTNRHHHPFSTPSHPSKPTSPVVAARESVSIQSRGYKTGGNNDGGNIVEGKEEWKDVAMGFGGRENWEGMERLLNLRAVSLDTFLQMRFACVCHSRILIFVVLSVSHRPKISPSPHISITFSSCSHHHFYLFLYNQTYHSPPTPLLHLIPPPTISTHPVSSLSHSFLTSSSIPFTRDTNALIKPAYITLLK